MMKKTNQVTDPKPWTEEEDRKLLEVVANLPRSQNRGRLARKSRDILGGSFPDRSYSSVISRYKIIKRRIPGFYLQPWTEAEEERLRMLYAGEIYHLNLKDEFPNRDPGSVVAKAERMRLTRKRLPIRPFKLSDTERAFAAGLIVADGSIGFYKLRRQTAWTTYADFYNTEKVLVDWFMERIPRGRFKIYGKNHSSPEKSGIRTRKPAWRWTLSDKPTLCLFLEMIYPYLLGVKKERARMILERYGPVIANDIAEYYLQKAS